MSGIILGAGIREKTGQLPYVDFHPTTTVGTDLKCQAQWLPGHAPSLGSLHYRKCDKLDAPGRGGGT